MSAVKKYQYNSVDEKRRTSIRRLMRLAASEWIAMAEVEYDSLATLINIINYLHSSGLKTSTKCIVKTYKRENLETNQDTVLQDVLKPIDLVELHAAYKVRSLRNPG